MNSEPSVHMQDASGSFGVLSLSARGFPVGQKLYPQVSRRSGRSASGCGCGCGCGQHQRRCDVQSRLEFGYRGAPSRVDRDDLQWHIAARSSDVARMPKGRAKTLVRKEEQRPAFGRRWSTRFG